MSQDDLITYKATEILFVSTLSPEAEQVKQALQAVVDSIYANAQSQLRAAHDDRERAAIERSALQAAEPYLEQMARLYAISSNPGVVISKT